MLPSCWWWLIWPIQNDAKETEKLLKPWHMGTYMRVLRESNPMNTNMAGFGWYSKILKILVLWTKVALALEGLRWAKNGGLLLCTTVLWLRMEGGGGGWG